MFGSEVMQSDARGFDNEEICYCSHKVKKTGDIGITNNGLDVPEFLVHDGLMMLQHPLICELTAVVLYEQDLMGDQFKLHHNCEHSCLADDTSLALRCPLDGLLQVYI